MATSFKVSIVTPEEALYEGEAELVIARSPEGDFGIMNGHVPFLAALVPGLVTVVHGGQRESYIVPGGFLEASGPQDDYHVIVLADDAEEAGDIDAAEAKRRIEEAKKSRDEDVDQRAEAEMRAALARPELGRD
ncbi:MAG: F-type H+-transporting ATPase subunit epsilon [Actinomycetota bacterium]|nr:F-type H+-transporting ATPase subunit epsilon [Actinomycetota bacterium]